MKIAPPEMKRWLRSWFLPLKFTARLGCFLLCAHRLRTLAAMFCSYHYQKSLALGLFLDKVSDRRFFALGKNATVTIR